jgi:CRISPR-associated protein Csh2
MSEEKVYLNSRREILFLYDIKMGNPNGDPDENRPRVLPDGTHYVTDVRLKRFVRDYFKSQGKHILVDNIEGKTTNLTGRVADYLAKKGKEKADGEDLVNIILDSFIDARLFGSSLAFKQQDDWTPKPIPKTLTGATQFNHGEALHKCEEVDIHGTTTFASEEEKTQGTFTTYFALRYALIAFNGVANEHSAQLSRLTDDDYNDLLIALWNGVRSAANTRTKVGQVPRFLINIEYNPNSEFQFGNLIDYIKPISTNEKEENEWSSPADYKLDISKLIQRLNEYKSKIAKIRYEISADLILSDTSALSNWEKLNIDLEKNEA